MENICISKKIDFEAGHRLKNHKSKCRNMHGHHYELILTVVGEVEPSQGHENDGMLVDFEDLKGVLKRCIKDPWDHAFIVAKNDEQVLNFLNSLDNHKTFITDNAPTVEVLTQLAFNSLKSEVLKVFGERIKVASVKLYETPTSYAEVKGL